MSPFKLYRPDERPDVEVLVDDEWWPGELWEWRQDDAGAWSGFCSWQRGPGQGRHTDVFPGERIRPDTVDRCPGGVSNQSGAEEIRD